MRLRSTKSNIPETQLVWSVGYQTYFLVYEGKVNFDVAEKKADVTKFKVSEVSTIIRKTRKCKLHETLKKLGCWKNCQRIYSRGICEVILRFCICSEEEKCHKDFMEQFLTGVTVIPEATVNTWLVQKSVDLTTFVIGMSPPVTMQNHRLLF